MSAFGRFVLFLGHVKHLAKLYAAPDPETVFLEIGDGPPTPEQLTRLEHHVIRTSGDYRAGLQTIWTIARTIRVLRPTTISMPSSSKDDLN